MITGKLYKVDNKDFNCLFSDVMFANSIILRMRGLLFREQLHEHQAMLLHPCASVHTIGMTYNIDIIFINKDWQITSMHTNVKPLRCKSALGASYTLETNANRCNELGLNCGDQLSWEVNNV